MRRYSTLFLLPLVTACAKSTGEISAQYISPMQYESYSCRQIEQEMQAVAARVSEVGGQVDSTASGDNAQMAVGIILFWPALFFLDGDTPQAAEYARLKGEFDALEKAAIRKGCNVEVERPQAAKGANPAKEEQPAYPSGSGRHYRLP